jgi:hypothetical protein
MVRHRIPRSFNQHRDGTPEVAYSERRTDVGDLHTCVGHGGQVNGQRRVSDGLVWGRRRGERWRNGWESTLFIPPFLGDSGVVLTGGDKGAPAS